MVMKLSPKQTIRDNQTLCCSICWNEKRKHMTFPNTKNLNIHLKMKHDANYKITIVENSTYAVSRLKLP